MGVLLFPGTIILGRVDEFEAINDQIEKGLEVFCFFIKVCKYTFTHKTFVRTICFSAKVF